MTARAQVIKKTIREISPIDVYQLLPMTNCRECNEANCMAFATRVVNGELDVADCPPLLTAEHRRAYNALEDLLAPSVKAVIIGTGTHSCTIGGEHVLYRHDFTYHHPTCIAVDVTDVMEETAFTSRIRKIEGFVYDYIGRTLRLDAVAVRCVSGKPENFARTVRNTAEITEMPLILCTTDPEVMRAGVEAAPGRRPLLYAATTANWKTMMPLAGDHECPLVLSAPHDIGLLRSLSATAAEFGVNDLVLEPGTSSGAGLSATVAAFSAIRRAACRHSDTLLGYPLMGVPMAVYQSNELSYEIASWKEAYIASLLMTRYADLLIMHSMEGWVLLPQLIWRFNLYTDPRKPVSVEAGLKTFGNPGRMSPVLLTTNYALTYFTVEADLKSTGLDCYLVIVDTGGISVESAVAGKHLNATSIAEAVRSSGVENFVDHRFLVLPGLAARLSGETEDTSGWRVLVGPKDSSGITAFLETHWPPPR